MFDGRRRSQGWVISPAVGIAVAAALVFAVVVVRVGESEQRSRRILAARSAVVTVIREGRVDGVPTPLTRAQAGHLVGIVNGLPHRPLGEQVCGAEVGSRERVVFSTVSGAIVVSADLGGCLGVDVASHGSDWGVQRWDPDDALKAAIAADLVSVHRS